MSLVEHVDTVEIVHSGRGVDGYPTTLLVDGKRRVTEVEITLVVDVDEGPLRLDVLHRMSFGNVYITFVPKRFTFSFGELRVTVDPRRTDRLNCCDVSIDSISIKARRLHIKFAEGEAPWIHLTFLPNMEHCDEPTFVCVDRASVPRER